MSEHLSYIADFVEAARAGSFVAAGEALDRTGSAISKSVSALERSLGVPLFVRTTRGLQLTADGERYLARATRALAELESARSELQPHSGELSGELRVLVHPLPGRARISAALPAWLERHSKLTVNLVFYEGYRGLDAVGADLAIIKGSPELGEANAGPAANLIVSPLAHSPNWLVAAPSYVQRFGSPQSPEDLSGHRCICVSTPRGPLKRWRFACAERQATVEVTPWLAMNDGAGVRMAIEAGAGVGWLPSIAFEEQVSRGVLSQLLPDWYGATADLMLVYPETARRVPKVRAFIDFLRQVFHDLDPQHHQHQHGFVPERPPVLRWMARDPLSGQGAPRAST